MRSPFQNKLLIFKVTSPSSYQTKNILYGSSLDGDILSALSQNSIYIIKIFHLATEIQNKL